MFIPLRFAPEEPAAATAEAPPIEAAPAAEPAIETPSAEAVPASEQEPGAEPKPEGEEPESGAPKVEDEAPVTPESLREDMLAQIEELRESDPKLAEEMEKRFGKPAEDVDERLLQQELELSRAGRGTRWRNASVAYQRFAPDKVEQQVVGVLSGLNENLKSAAKQLAQGQITDSDGNPDPDQLQFDLEEVFGLIKPWLQAGHGAIRDIVTAATHSIVVDALEADPSHRYLDADERKRFQAAVNAGKFDQAISLQLGVAVRAAPEDFTKKATKKAEEDAGLLKLYRDTREKLGNANGRGSLTGVPAPKTGEKPVKDMSDEEWAQQTPEDHDARTARFLQKQGVNPIG